MKVVDLRIARKLIREGNHEAFEEWLLENGAELVDALAAVFIDYDNWSPSRGDTACRALCRKWGA